MANETTPTVPVTSESTQATATESAAVTSAATAQEPAFSLDDFINADFSDNANLQETFSKEHKGLPAFKEIIQRHTNEEGRKYLSNIRADYTRKTQELANARKQLDAERTAFQQERLAVANSDYNKRMAELAKQDNTNLDLYEPEQMKQYLEIEMAKRLDEQIKPIREKAEQEALVLEAERFIAQHPEIKTDAYKAKLTEIYQRNPNVSIDDAYLMAKGMLADEAATQAAAQKQQAKSFIKDTPNGRKVDVAALPPGLSAREIHKILSSAK